MYWKMKLIHQKVLMFAFHICVHSSKAFRRGGLPKSCAIYIAALAETAKWKLLFSRFNHLRWTLSFCVKYFFILLTLQWCSVLRSCVAEKRGLQNDIFTKWYFYKANELEIAKVCIEVKVSARKKVDKNLANNAGNVQKPTTVEPWKIEKWDREQQQSSPQGNCHNWKVQFIMLFTPFYPFQFFMHHKSSYGRDTRAKTNWILLHATCSLQNILKSFFPSTLSNLFSHA